MNILRPLLAIIIAAHGIGHILFLIPLLGIADWGQATHSWLLSDITAARLVGTVIWVAVVIAFGAAVLGLMTQQSWWRTVAVAAAVVSTIGLLLFWAAPVTGSVWAALIVNVVIVIALALLRVPSVDALGS